MDLLIAFSMAVNGLTFLSLSKDNKNKKYQWAGILMLVASFISLLTFFFYK
ncbi:MULTISPECIES: hypothetical protein [Leuconostoc]|uniref:hypothetical protein n=1 Tax=Leuconostoc TaxID=1243 RepID=UPI001FB86C01|nr:MULTISPECIES: hypothetical protein [Leuconostoc]MCJ2167002.1 hypothetical protein [Leuconostoc citreum]MCP1276613.1 hypothetical protein [Leuconostoc citreum]MDM7642323.1 hypothetical protein [Leuconostoc citreum]MDY5164258.1 hypothetical protein [Leuconostoc falkenbergense]